MHALQEGIGIFLAHWLSGAAPGEVRIKDGHEGLIGDVGAHVSAVDGGAFVEPPGYGLKPWGAQSSSGGSCTLNHLILCFVQCYSRNANGRRVRR